MISLRIFVLILLTLCVRELSGFSFSLRPSQAWVVIATITAVFAVAIKILAFRAVRQSTWSGRLDRNRLVEAFQSKREKIEWIWCAALPLTLLASGWFSWTQPMHNAGWPESLLLGSCFVPSIAFLILVEMTAAQVDVIGKTPRRRGWLEPWLLRMRLGELVGLLTCLLPVLLLSGASDCGLWIEQRFAIAQGWIKFPAMALLVLAFVAVVPMIMTRWSAGQPLPDALRERIDAVQSKLGMRGIRCVLIPSHERWCGAAVVGWLPGYRQLWLGDATVAVLNPRQLDMVVLHELAHVSRMHWFWRIVPILVAMLTGASLWGISAELGLAESMVSKLAVGLASGVALVVGIGVMARHCELDADRVACDLAVRTAFWSGEHSPASELAGALSTLIGGATSDTQATWLHPSLDQRIDQLSRWTASRRSAVLNPNA